MSTTHDVIHGITSTGCSGEPYGDVHRERIRAHTKHDVNGGSMERKLWDDPAWLPVLTEELGEVARELCERELGNVNASHHVQSLREELVQVAAMACAWISAIDDDAGRRADLDAPGEPLAQDHYGHEIEEVPAGDLDPDYETYLGDTADDGWR